MRTLTSAIIACAVRIALPSEACGQTPSSPILMFTIHGGFTAGNDLWAVAKQPLCVTDPLSGTCGPGNPRDTVGIGRTMGGGIGAGLTVAYFPGNGHLGYFGDVSFVGLTLDDGCTGLYFTSGPGSTNELLCQSVSDNSITMGAVSFVVGLHARASAFGVSTPYLRVGGGLLAYSQSTLDMSGLIVSNGVPERLSIVVDNHPTKVSPLLVFGGGFRIRASPGYGVRIELQDLVAPFHRLDGPVNSLGQGPTSTKVYHHLNVVLGLDIVLERKRGRRY